MDLSINRYDEEKCQACGVHYSCKSTLYDVYDVDDHECAEEYECKKENSKDMSDSIKFEYDNKSEDKSMQ